MDMNKKGQVLVFLAISIIVLLGFSALGIDVGYMYSVRHDLQRCADAGALAGASRFINDPNAGEAGTWGDANVFAEATARAIDFATKDNVVQTKLDPSNGNDNVIVTFDQGPDRIKVQTERTVPLFFAKLFLGATKRITAFAVAEAASVSENTTCIAPLAVPMPWNENGGDPYAYDDGDVVNPIDNTLDEFCQNFDDAGDFTTWDYPTHDNGTRSGRDSYLCPGALMKLKIGSPQQTDPGWFRPLDLSNYAVDCNDPENNSAPKLYTWLLKHGADCSKTNGCRVVLDANDPTQELDVLTGDRVGPTIQAIAPQFYSTLPGGGYPASIDWDSVMDGREDPGDPSNYEVIGSYTDPGADWRFSAGGDPNGPRSLVTSRRIWRLPIYDPTVPPVGQGTNMYINPVKFVGFWVQDVSPVNNGQATITGRLLEISGVGLGGPDPGPGGATVKIIRLVE